jgi:hypothetical protein
MTSPITIGTIRTRATDAGSHWFDRDTMRLWGTRLLSTVYEGAERRAYFVSSEPQGFIGGGPRLYTVRVSHPDGRIDTVGDLGAFDDRRNALRGARIAAANDAASQ